MRPERLRIFALIALIAVLASTANAQLGAGKRRIASPTQTVVLPDSTRWGVYLQPGFVFLGFDDRTKWESARVSRLTELKAAAIDRADSLRVASQSFQQVDFAFPVGLGLEWQFVPKTWLSASAGFFTSTQRVVLTDRFSQAEAMEYTLQGFPAYLQITRQIPTTFLSLDGHERFSASARMVWMLPGTEIHGSFGSVQAEPKWQGNGWGLSLGYLVGHWNRFDLYGDLGYSSVRVSSSEPWSKVVPDTTSQKASWNLGGMQLLLRVRFHLAPTPPSWIPQPSVTLPPPASTDSSAVVPTDSTSTEPIRRAPQGSGDVEADEQSKEKARQLQQKLRKLKGQ